MKSLNNNVSLLTKGYLYFVIKSSVSNPDSAVFSAVFRGLMDPGS